MRRVVITGLGMVSPLADGVKATWERLLAGQSGAGLIKKFDASEVVTKYACEVPLGDGSNSTFNADSYLAPKEQRKVDDFILYGLAAAQQAVIDSGWMPEADADRERTGVMIGSGIGGLQSIAATALLIQEKGPRRVSPFFIPGALINLVSGHVSIKFGFKGPNHSVVTACSTGAHAIGDASRIIRYGDADVMVAGGAEAAVGVGVSAGACSLGAGRRSEGGDSRRRSREGDRGSEGGVSQACARDRGAEGDGEEAGVGDGGVQQAERVGARGNGGSRAG